MNTENEIYQKLKEFILKVSRRKTIGDDDDIFEGGIVNSLFAMQLVIFLEKQLILCIIRDVCLTLNYSKIEVL